MLWRRACRDQTVDPNNPAQLRNLRPRPCATTQRTAGGGRIGQPLLAHRLRHQHRRQPVDHAAEHQSRQRRQAFAGAARLQAAAQRQFHAVDARGVWPAQVFDVVVPLETTASLCHRACGRAHHAAARLLCAVADRGAHRDGLCAGDGAGGGLSAQQSGAAADGADQPPARLLDRSARGEDAQEPSDEPKTPKRRIRPARVSTKIERIGQRMRNVEEVFSALQENLDQILGNLQDGILLFTGEGRAVLVSEAARRFLGIEARAFSVCMRDEIFDRSQCWAKVCARPSRPASPRQVGDSHRNRPAHSGLARVYSRRRYAPGAGRAGHAARS